MKLYPLRLIPDNTNINFMNKKMKAFFITGLLVVFSIAYIGFFKLNFGIDFTGGILIEARTEQHIDIAKLRSSLTHALKTEISLQSASENNDIMIRIASNKNANEHQQMQEVSKIKQVIEDNIQDNNIEYRKVDFVGPQVGKQMINNGIIAVILAFVAIMFYVWVRFEWQYSIGIVLALIHDVIVSVGFMSVMGLEFNQTSLAAILTIVGYSVNDSVVIYDRIRENFRKYKKLSLNALLNLSINETLSRTILTVLTTLLSALSLVLFGGEALRSFSLVVFFGIVVGTYSSIYISAPVLTFFKLKGTNV